MLPYTPDQLCALVGDVQRYPDFVPWITSMRTWGAKESPDGSNTLDAEASVGFSMLTERFATRVRRDPVNRMVTVSLISGPFKRLVNEWRFVDDPRGTKIEFMIDFEFKSRLLTMMLEANFNRAVEKLINCFDARAQALYGASAPPAPAAFPAQP